MPLPSGLYAEAMTAASKVTLAAAAPRAVKSGRAILARYYPGLEVARLGGVGDWRTVR